jgi:acetyl-CoA/propionyl-CoA carboxylase biotin carboxyl carrier protein
VREAQAAFGRGECFVEQFLDQPRHIEAQVLADAHGNVRVLGTRDCSLQRRNQKLVEEAPRPSSATQRARIHQAAVDICRAAGYVSAGTVEFLLSQSGAISFLEVNTRLQVEHPVTEETTGFDLVREQFRVAEGARLDAGDVPAPHGHAFEFRINAEDVGRGFLPAPGRITRFDTPGGGRARGQRRGRRLGGGRPIRLPAGQADRVGPHAPGRHRARAAPLAEFTIEGVPTVLPFHRAVMQHADFTSDDKLAVHTRWIETDLARQWQAEPAARPEPPATDGLMRTAIEIDGRRVLLGLPAHLLAGLAAAQPGGPRRPPMPPAADEHAVTRPAAGTLLSWKVADGAAVQAGDLVAVMEAMKMEMQVHAHRAGHIRQHTPAGGFQAAGATLARIE